MRGCPLRGIHGTPTVESHAHRLMAMGWPSARAVDMNTVYRQHIDPKDRQRLGPLLLKTRECNYVGHSTDSVFFRLSLVVVFRKA